MTLRIPFNKPYLTGKEMHYVYQAVYSGKISGNGIFTNKCQQYFNEHYLFKKSLLTTSCTDALEMTAILSDIEPGDEVIVPAYTFVSSAIAFVRQGARIIFVDSREDHPGMDENLIEELITDKTKAIVSVHYGGVACDMDKILNIANKYNLLVIEDAAQAIDSYYNGKALGSIGNMGTFSFHETKNINSGEGGLLTINDDRYLNRAEIIWEKGTNRAEFFRGEVNKYGWCDIGSSFLPSEIIAAYLWAQLENLASIQNRRIEIWNRYFEGLKSWATKNQVRLPVVPEYATQNGHLFYIICKDENQREYIIKKLAAKNIKAVFHYLSLHKSPYYKHLQGSRVLPNSEYYSNNLLRLPLYFELTNDEQDFIIDTLINL